MSKRSARRILSGAKTAGGQVRLYRHMRQIDGYKIDDLSPSQEDELREMLAHTGDDGVEAINEMDRDTVDSLLKMSPSCSRGPVSGLALGGGGSCLNEDTLDEFRKSIATASTESGLSYRELDEVVRRIDGLDEAERTHAIQFVAETGTEGVETLSNLNNDELEALVSIVYRGDVEGEPSELIDAELTARDMLELTEEKIALDETMGVVKPNEPYGPENLDTIWLEKGSLGSAADRDDWIEDQGGAGWEHIRHNHVETPSGNEFAQKFGPEYDDPNSVKRLIINSVRKGEPIRHDGDIIYVYEVDGKTVSTVVGDNGYIVTSVPTDLTD